MIEHTKHFFWLLSLGPKSAWTPKLAFDCLVGLELRESLEKNAAQLIDEFGWWDSNFRIGRN